MRLPEKAINRCLPRATTDSMVRPASGRSSTTRFKVRKYPSCETSDDPAGEHTVKGLSGAEDRVPFRHGTP